MHHVIFVKVETYLPYLKEDYVAGLRTGRLALIRRLRTPRRQISAAEAFVQAAKEYLDLMQKVRGTKVGIYDRIWEAMRTDDEVTVRNTIDELMKPLEDEGNPLLEKARGAYGVLEMYILRRHKSLVNWNTIMTRYAAQGM